MAQRELTLRQKLRYALEEGRPAENADDFAALIGAVLDLPGYEKEHYPKLCEIVWGEYLPGEAMFFANWATGAVQPTSMMRSKAVRILREHFNSALEGP